MCQDITVTADGGVTATARNCLTAAEFPTEQPAGPLPGGASPSQQPDVGAVPLSVRISGPGRQRVGEVARFKIEIANNTNQAIGDIQISNHFDASLQPKQATESYTWLPGNDLGWKGVSLAAGKTASRQIEFICSRQTQRACNRVTVSAAGIEPTSDTACLEVLALDVPAARPGGQQGGSISVTVADTADPIRINGETTYQILVSNTGTESAFDVTVTATFGDQLKLAGMSAPVEGGVLANSVRFAPIRELRRRKCVELRAAIRRQASGHCEASRRRNKSGPGQPRDSRTNDRDLAINDSGESPNGAVFPTSLLIVHLAAAYRFEGIAIVFDGRPFGSLGPGNGNDVKPRAVFQ